MPIHGAEFYVSITNIPPSGSVYFVEHSLRLMFSHKDNQDRKELLSKHPSYSMALGQIINRYFFVVLVVFVGKA